MPILIAEDEPAALEQLATKLEKEGYRVIRAADGREALNYLQTELEHG